MIKETQFKIDKENFSMQQHVASIFDKIKSNNGNLNAFLNIFDIDQNIIKDIDQRIKTDTLLKMDGATVALKDNILLKGSKATAGSNMLKDYIATYDATVVRKIKENGGLIIGKTNMDEFAMGSSNETSAFGVVKNPVDANKVPGGSSGGSAAAVAAGMADVALGSDTAGSIRQPASFCGVVGFKPSYGAVSRFGLMSMCSSLDVIGPIAKNVADCEIVFDVICGKDDYDHTSINVEKYDQEWTKEDLKNLTVGVPNEYFVSGVDEEVELQIKNFIIKLQELGVTVKNISLPHTKYALPCYYIVMPAEVSSNLARYDNIRYGTKVEELEYLKIKNLKEMYFKTRGNGFGKEVKRRILLGAYVLSKGYYDDYYLRAQKVRRLIKNDFDNAFEKVDIILTPTTPNVAFGLGEKNKDPISMYLSDIFTVPMNLAGVPAISLPLANNKAGLPIGLQLVGQFKQDKKLLKIAKLIEEIIK